MGDPMTEKKLALYTQKTTASAMSNEQIFSEDEFDLHTQKIFENLTKLKQSLTVYQARVSSHPRGPPHGP